MFVLVFGNLVIGLVEGGVAKAFGARWWAFPAILFGNYFSAWVGLNVIWAAGGYWQILDALGGDPLRHAIPATWITFGLLAAMGVLIESPFYWLSFLKTARPRRPKVLRSLMIGNAITCTGLAFVYAGSTKSSLVRALDIAPHASAVANDVIGDRPWVYYIALDEREVRRIRPDGSADELVRRTGNSLDEVRLAALQAGDSPVMLALTEADDSEPLYTEILGARQRSIAEDNWRVIALDDDVGARAGVFPRDAEHGAHTKVVAPFGPAADLRRPEDRTFQASFHPDGWFGIRLEGEDVPPTLALDSPFIERTLTPFGVTVLPGDVLVFELAHEWDGHHAGIYIVSIPSRTIAPLVKGRSPVVVYPHPEEP
jgi:hypothetical protein